ncbi:unnamed protein product [Prorocentrum cordatum]|uniref:Uncharacterized protein n=1 Tax=Prorocentrum cordatum TaxID=2364126 RepID=A0ABN9X8K2_9DINO|nr:unnamed protein product [Polarella glacialis]
MGFLHQSSGVMCISIGSLICDHFLSSLEKLFWLGGYYTRSEVKESNLGATKTHFWKRLIYLLKDSTPAADRPMNWMNFSADAPWKQKGFMDMREWFNHCRGRGKTPCLLFRPRDEGGLGMHIFAVFEDGLHNMELGSAQKILGNVMWLLVYGGRMGIRPPKVALRQLWLEIAQGYRKRGTKNQFNEIELDSFTDPKAPNNTFPELHGKAANVRHLAPVLVEIFEGCATDSDYDGHVRELLRHLCSYYHVLDHKGPDGAPVQYLPDYYIRELRIAIDGLQKHYNWLSVQNPQPKNARLRGMQPKLHHGWHVGFQAVFQNPRAAWCYSNEDLVGRIATIVKAAASGIPAAQRMPHIMPRYLQGQSLRVQSGWGRKPANIRD